jgi:hypothetical protein
VKFNFNNTSTLPNEIGYTLRVPYKCLETKLFLAVETAIDTEIIKMLQLHRGIKFDVSVHNKAVKIFF